MAGAKRVKSQADNLIYLHCGPSVTPYSQPPLMLQSRWPARQTLVLRILKRGEFEGAVSRSSSPSRGGVPCSHNRIERLTAILLLLQDQPRTSDEIARQFEVSRRTVLRDVQALCEMGVPIVAREGVGGGYSLLPDYRIAPPPLTTHEAFLLLLALSAITGLSDAPFAQERASLLAKLRALLPGQLPDVEPLLATVGMEVPERLERAPFLEPLLQAAQQGRWVEIVYQSAERRSTQHILPRQITAHNGYWYCRAYAHEHEEERTYRVDRIRALAQPDAQLQHFGRPRAAPLRPRIRTPRSSWP